VIDERIDTHRRRLRAMSCGASIVIAGHSGDAETLLDAAARRLSELEARWSRFLPGSDVTRLNLEAGRAVRVSADTVRLVESMVRAWHATEGCYDPTLAATMVDLGYAASRHDASSVTVLPPAARRRGRPAAIGVDRSQRVVMLPAGTAIDPGGIGKGLAADIVVGELVDAGALGALVEVGGDVRVAGRPAPAHSWTISVDTSTTADTTIELRSGGVATSTLRRRRWQHGGSERHHLVDPATLESSANGCVSCTVIAGTGAWAEAFTKVAFVRPLAEAIEIFDRHRLAATLTTTGGLRLRSATWKDYER
jgi:thiamine biosynthesis lipoprotein